MFLPIELQQHINEYAKPMTRSDWRQGCSISRLFRLDENKEIVLLDFKYFIFFEHYLRNR